MSETAVNRRIGVYPGTFDPITNGHLDIIERATKLVDHLIIGVAEHTNKDMMFNTAERAKLIQGAVDNLKDPRATIEVKTFDTLLMDFAAEMQASMIIRGLRAISDFEYEFQMTGMNAHLNPEIETTFLMAKDMHQFISSRFVKEIGRLNGDISKFVPKSVEKALTERFGQ